MSLRKSPIRSAALLAACRANARKSTGPRTRAGKARSALNGLRHGRRARKLAWLLPRGLSFEDRLLYNWILRAIRNSFLPQDAPAGGMQEGKIRRAAIQAWCQVRAELQGKSDGQSVYVTDYRPLHAERSRPDLICFRLEREHPNGMLTFRVRPRGRNPRRPVGPDQNSSHGQRSSDRGLSKPDGSPRARTVQALWRGDAKVEDWGPEPLPDPETDPAGLYHWRRDMQRELRAWRRAEAREQAREEPREQDSQAMTNWVDDWLAPLVADARAVGDRAKPALPAPAPAIVADEKSDGNAAEPPVSLSKAPEASPPLLCPKDDTFVSRGPLRQFAAVIPAKAKIGGDKFQWDQSDGFPLSRE